MRVPAASPVFAGCNQSVRFEAVRFGADGEAPQKRTGNRRDTRRQQHETEVASGLSVGNQGQQHRSLGCANAMARRCSSA